MKLDFQGAEKKTNPATVKTQPPAFLTPNAPCRFRASGSWDWIVIVQARQSFHSVG